MTIIKGDKWVQIHLKIILGLDVKTASLVMVCCGLIWSLNGIMQKGAEDKRNRRDRYRGDKETGK